MKTSFPKDQIRIVLLEGVHERAAELLAAERFQVARLPGALEGEALAAAVADAHAVGIRSKTRLDAAALGSASRLLAVGCFCIGTNQVDVQAARLSGAPVFNSPFSNTRSVAELTIAEIVALHRRLADRSAQMHAGEWVKSAAGAHEVRGRTLGIVGYGRIGSQVSVLAEALGMRVVFYDVSSVLPLGNARAARSLEELLKQSDVVTVHVPATERTKGLLGRAQIGTMKRGAFLINNARGGVVDEEALAGAIREGKIGGAAADVFGAEPAGSGQGFESPLRGLPNVILTPHIGGSTEEAQEAIAEDVAGKLIKFINNGSTTGAVNVPQVELPPQWHGSPSRDGQETDEGVEASRLGEPCHQEPCHQRRHRILHFHRNVPGVLSKMHGVIAEVGANVSAEYLRTDEEIGYVVLDVDPSDGGAILERLKGIPETVRVRMLW